MTAHLDRAFASIMSTMIDTGEAPHHTELANQLDMKPDEAKELVRELMGSIPGWLHPGTDYIASFPPFNNQPTQYRISVDGKQSWYGQ